MGHENTSTCVNVCYCRRSATRCRMEILTKENLVGAKSSSQRSFQDVRSLSQENQVSLPRVSSSTQNQMEHHHQTLGIRILSFDQAPIAIEVFTKHQTNSAVWLTDLGCQRQTCTDAKDDAKLAGSEIRFERGDHEVSQSRMSSQASYHEL